MNTFDDDTRMPPRCQACATRRLHAGEPIQRLVHRPGTIGYCVDCGAVVWNDSAVEPAA
jgi:hypothetical protein